MIKRQTNDLGRCKHFNEFDLIRNRRHRKIRKVANDFSCRRVLEHNALRLAPSENRRRTQIRGMAESSLTLNDDDVRVFVIESLQYRGFEQEGFEIVAAFDAEPARARERTQKVSVHSMERVGDVIRKHHVRMAIVAVPGAGAQEVVNALVEEGVVGILNFAPVIPHVPENVTVNNVNLAIELENLSYFVQE